MDKFINMLSEELNQYVEEFTSHEDKILHELQRETNLKVLYPRMLSGSVQGKFLEMISHMIRPEFILEVGTYTGYSAICFARGMASSGQLHTIEINPELCDFANKYFVKSKTSERITQHIGNALEIIPELKMKWDLVFLDADKENYLNYYNLVFDNVKKGGFILADNVLWDGKVLDPKFNKDKETRGIVEFNNFVKNDSRVENLLMPLRDGIMILRKL